METVQNMNIKAQLPSVAAGPARLAGWFALAVFVAWILAFVGGMLSSGVFPGAADQFIPAKIQANVFLASLNWFTQIALGTALVAFALPFSDYLVKPMNNLVRFALIGGLLGGVFFIAAGAGGQENVFQSVLASPEQNMALARAIGLPDLTVINVANDLVSGGMRSTGSYLVGWSMVLWGIAALKTRKLPAVLSWVQIVTGILFALTVWIGPITGPFSFLGLLVWSLWLGIFLLRAIRAVYNGDAIFSRSVAQRLIHYFSTAKSQLPMDSFPELTDRERQILTMMVQGNNAKGIADILVLSVKTIRNHISNICTELEVFDRTQAI